MTAETLGPKTLFTGESGLPGVLETHSTFPLQTGAVNVGISNRMIRDVSMVENARFETGARTLPLEDALIASSRIYFATGVGMGSDISLALPVYYEFLPGAPANRTESSGVGDFSAQFKAKLPWNPPFVSFALLAMATLPTSSGRGLLPKQLAHHPYEKAFPNPLTEPFGLRKARIGAGIGTTFDLSAAKSGPRLAVHMNVLGDRVLAEDGLNPMGTFTVSLAAEAYLARWLRMEAEYRQQRLMAEPSGLGSPLAKTATLGAGLATALPLGFTFRAGALLAPGSWNPYLPLTYEVSGTSYDFAYRFHPPVSATLQLAWQGFPLGRDRDHDGLPDGQDRCPSAAEDIDGYQDGDGCPEMDNDGDGIPDGKDGCPYASEDHDGFENADGCPEMDNDCDGLLDSADQCPNDAEDRDGESDSDGCPDLDDDRDGVPDVMDKCPKMPENKNGIDDEDGCPDRDTDGDGIPDSRDRCPREDEIVNFFLDEDGCPDEKPEPLRDAVLTGMEFQSGSSELLPASFMVLDGLAARLFAYPGTEIEIQGHLDDRAGPKAKSLSLARAQAVAEYLFNRGIETRRIKTIGFGASKPLASNRTAKGRETNRRIQIRRLN